MKAALDVTLMTSRFFTPDDPRMEFVAGVRLPQHWWSRPYEYAWASQFTGPELTVLDAGCGVSHPLKWHLAGTCAHVDAIDTDAAIGDDAAMYRALTSDFDETSIWRLEHHVFEQTGHPVWESWQGINATVQRMDMCGTTFLGGRFDRVFCVSVLEHMAPVDRTSALREFARLLASGGLVVLTVDVPPVRPSELVAMAAEAGLVPAGPVEVSFAGLGGCMGVYRLLLKGAA